MKDTNVTLQFYSIYPGQKPPCLAKDTTSDLPKRAKLFCHPFRAALQAGYHFFSPIDFDVHLTDNEMQLRTTSDEGVEKIVTITNDPDNQQPSYLLLQDTSPSKSKQALAEYRERLKDEQLPEGINLDTFGFYEVMVNGLYEGNNDFFIQLWLGGVVETPPGYAAWVKHPGNRLLSNGLTCLDGLIETDRWQGWFAIVLKPEIKNEWLSVSTEQPICQILPYPLQSCELHSTTSSNTPQDKFLEPLKWHIFDPSYGRKPGKYQREG